MDLFCNLLHFAFKLSLHECLTLVQSLNINAQGKKEHERNSWSQEKEKCQREETNVNSKPRGQKEVLRIRIRSSLR